MLSGRWEKGRVCFLFFFPLNGQIELLAVRRPPRAEAPPLIGDSVNPTAFQLRQHPAAS